MQEFSLAPECCTRIFFPSVFSLHITKNEHFMRYAYTSREQKMIKKRLNAKVHTTQELNLLVILPDISCERPRVRRHLNVKIQNGIQDQGWHYGKGQIY